MFCFLILLVAIALAIWVCKNKLVAYYESYIREFWPNSANGVGSKPPSFFEWLKYKVTGK
jgi:hypothetical protein